MLPKLASMMGVWLMGSSCGTYAMAQDYGNVVSDANDPSKTWETSGPVTDVKIPPVVSASPSVVVDLPKPATRALTDDERAAITEAVTRQLNDPDSAKIRWQEVQTGHQPFYCGEMNAKNTYGGYIGYLPFEVDMFTQNTSSGKIKIVIIPALIVKGNTDEASGFPTSEYVSHSCNEHGYNF